jgi:hypothetical protein
MQETNPRPSKDRKMTMGYACPPRTGINASSNFSYNQPWTVADDETNGGVFTRRKRISQTPICEMEATMRMALTATIG